MSLVAKNCVCISYDEHAQKCNEICNLFWIDSTLSLSQSCSCASRFMTCRTLRSLFASLSFANWISVASPTAVSIGSSHSWKVSKPVKFSYAKASKKSKRIALTANSLANFIRHRLFGQLSNLLCIPIYVVQSVTHSARLTSQPSIEPFANLVGA